MTDTDFAALGIMAVGIRVQLRERSRIACRDPDGPESTVLKRLQERRSQRSGNRRTQAHTSTAVRVPKSTRRAIIGWKHQDANSVLYKVIPPQKGGGKQEIDIEKKLDISEATEVIKNHYFKNGVNIASGTSLEDVEYHIANFRGDRITSGISFGEYVEKLGACPIRVYLHTRNKSETTVMLDMPDRRHDVPDMRGPTIQVHETTDMLDMPDRRHDVPDMRGPTIQVHETTDMLDMPDRRHDEPDMRGPTIQVDEVGIYATTTDMTMQQLEDGEQDEDTGTPTITFPRIRHRSRGRLSLRLPSEVVTVDERNSEDDEELQTAILQSMDTVVEPATLENLLKGWMANTLDDETNNELIIHRSKVMESTDRAMSRTTFSCRKRPKICFSGEMGDDYGGPTREYFRLLLRAITSNILEGPENSLTFQHSMVKLENAAYTQAGRCVAWSLLHGGPGLPVLSPNIYKLVLGKADVELTIDDVVDDDARTNILKICDAQEMTDLQDIQGWMADQGLPYVTDISAANNLVDLAVKNTAYYRIHAEIMQFGEGLNSVGGLKDMMCRHSDVLSPLLTHTDKAFTAGSIRSMLQVNYSDEGSNNRQSETDTIYAFDLFMQDCEDGNAKVSLQMLMQFWTGASYPPPLGFHKTLEINFNSDVDRLPTASTCDMFLELARGMEPEILKKKLSKAIRWGGEFHLA